LGKGLNNLGSGIYVDGKLSTQFNGSFKVLDKWLITDGGGNVQDIHYHDGVVYNNSKRSMDEKGLILWKKKLCTNGVVEKTKIFIPIYDDLGNLKTSVDSGEGITIRDGKIYCVLLGSHYFIMDIPI
jgi:hypothetical protein